MSTPRSLRVSQSVKRELSSLMRDLKDDRIAGIVSVVDVEMTGDCRSARIYISVFGDEETQKNTLAALTDRQGFIRGELCRRLSLRFAPEIQFRLDTSLERGSRVTDIISKISRGEL